MNILAVIPARGNSKGIPRKNVRLLNGKPLIHYAINNVLNSSFQIDCCVSTDNDEIAEIASGYDLEVIKRDGHLANDDITLDPVIFDAVYQMKLKNNKHYDIIITIQATSPLLRGETLDDAIRVFINNKKIDTLISGVNNPHLSWKRVEDEFIPNYEERVNRQYLPSNYIETGAFLITRASNVRENSRIGNKIGIYEVDDKESIDIDTPQDWWIAETELSRKNILIRVEAFSEIGMGHVYRGLTLAYGLIHHNIQFITSDYSNLAIKKLKESYFPFKVVSSENEIIKEIESFHCDIFINDNLNSASGYTKMLKNTGSKLVSFEDLGEGSKDYDIVINDLYSPTSEFSGNQYFWGSDYYLLRDEFLNNNPGEFNNEVKDILVIFGGADPSNLTYKVLSALKYVELFENINFTFVVGPGYEYWEELRNLKFPGNVSIFRDVKTMAKLMKKTDLAISSQGRTMLELASMGVPTILIAQNARELTHEFGYLNNGFINLGLGEKIDSVSIANTINWLVKTPDIRYQMREQMLNQNLREGLKKVLKLILN